MLSLMLMVIGCNKSDKKSKWVNTLHGNGYLVPISNKPSIDSSYEVVTGNIDLVPALFDIKAVEVRVWIKTSENEPWSEIEASQKNQATWTYDATTQQVRFQWCDEGWAYMVAYK